MSVSQQGMTTTTTPVDSGAVRRALAGVGLIGIALIHALDLNEKLEELPYVGFLFIGLIIASFVIAEGLVRSDDARIWLAAGALAGATILGYVISRSVGLPGEGGEEIGKWLEPLGLASLVVEGMVVLLTVGRFASKRATA